MNKARISKKGKKRKKRKGKLQVNIYISVTDCTVPQSIPTNLLLVVVCPFLSRLKDQAI